MGAENPNADLNDAMKGDNWAYQPGTKEWVNKWSNTPAFGDLRQNLRDNYMPPPGSVAPPDVPPANYLPADPNVLAYIGDDGRMKHMSRFTYDTLVGQNAVPPQVVPPPQSPPL